MSQHQSNWLQRLAVSAACVLSIAPAVSQAATIGPDPTSSTLNATAGSFAVSTSTVVAPVGFGGGTIYYPTVAGQYGVIAMSPGFTATQSSIAWLGRRLATWGFVVITINTNTTMDQPASRATQLMAALNYVLNSSGTTVRSRLDTSRLAVAGHSMGGGGTLIAARDNPTLKAAVPLMPWSPTSNFSAIKLPTLVVTADGDTIAPAATMGKVYYNSIPSSTYKAYAELNNGTHFSPNTTNTPIGRYTVAWMKRFLDDDTRFSPYLCGSAHTSYATSLVFDSYLQNCPY